ncbi:MAG: GlsB/YeaQ/YmgE family stress response membrane protein [Bauldia sp.]
MSNIQGRDILVWAILGIIAGAIADAIVPGNGNILTFLVAGVLGAFVGGFLARQFNIRLNLGSVFVEQMIIAVLGAIIVLIVARIIF